ncbi:DUF4174 domain-containing protein [Cellulophaga sp. Z1A5H]|uniref:DUF4174 domain-containing protein n=1 Tax=Cellulophaga sp. Z1A5H TaxID=2687291 RepID=UPI0013FDF0F5|nr:DUF4174 domain-containing protein [Cellulophaga sp. Z1A5H]
MKHILKYVTILACFFFYSPITMAQDISDFKWKNRVLLLVDTELNSENIKQQIKVFEGLHDAFQERDIIYFIITSKGSYDSDKQLLNLKGLETYYHKDFSGLILLGKDGGIKLKTPFIVTAKTIISLIDSMPMRQSEMNSPRSIKLQ